MKLAIIQRRALEKSIIKWEKIVGGTGVDRFNANCELRIRFALNDKDCVDCPVSIEVEGIGCLDTPWMGWLEHQQDIHNNRTVKELKVECPTCRELAIKEVKFLKSLRGTI